MVIAPSMNVHMFKHPAVAENLQQLRKRKGHTIVEPEEGFLACGYEGKGRLASLDTLLDKASKALKK